MDGNAIIVNSSPVHRPDDCPTFAKGNKSSIKWHQRKSTFRDCANVLTVMTRDTDHHLPPRSNRRRRAAAPRTVEICHRIPANGNGPRGLSSLDVAEASSTARIDSRLGADGWGRTTGRASKARTVPIGRRG
ncbi:unnamed protein product [Calypogeia fissa]